MHREVAQSPSTAGRHAILEAVGFAAQRFLARADWAESVDEVLARIGQAADVSRVYIFECRAAENGEVIAAQRHEWVAPGVSPQIDNSDLQAFPLRAGGFERWLERLGAGDVVHGAVRDFPEPERAVLAAQDIDSLVVVPIFAGQEWWGFIGFDLVGGERAWGDGEVDALRAAAGLLGSAIQRNRAEERSREMLREQIARAEAEAGHARTAAILESIGDIFYALDGDWCFTYINRRAERLLRPLASTREELLGRCIWDVFPQGIGTAYEEALRRAARDKVPSTLETPSLLLPDAFFEIRVYPAADGGVSVFLRDITAAKQTEQALRAAEDRYRRLFEDNLAGSFVATVDGRVLACNSAYARIFGFDSIEEALRTNVQALYPAPEQRERKLALLRERGRLEFYELELRRKDGSPVRVVENAVPTYDAAGELVELRGYLLDITEQKAAEEALRRSEEQFRTLIESALDIITVLNPGGTIRYGSPAVERVLGFTPDELAGRSLVEFVHPDDASAVLSAFTQGMQSPGYTASLEFRFRHKDGGWRVLEAAGRSMVDDPAVAGIIMNSRDITERRASEEARRQLAAILEATTDFVATTDAHGRVLYMNRAGREMVGLQPDEDVRTLSLADFYPSWATAEVVREGIPAAIREGTWSTEVALLGPGGVEIPVSQVVIAHKTSAGALEFLSTIMRDITERKRAEEALRHSEQHFRSLIEHAQDIITILDADANIVFESPAVEHVLGYKPDELVGRGALELVHPDDVPHVARALEAGRGFSRYTGIVEFRFRHADGSWRTLEARGQNLLEDPAVSGIVINSRDITERKEAEEALRRSEEQFRQAQKMEAVGRLAGGVAHDFNNLLTAIKGHTRLLLADLAEQDPMRVSVQEIEKASERAATLTRQLLAFSRKQVLQPKVLDLNASVRDMENMLRRLIGEHIELVTVLEDDAGRIKADPGQIEQVIMNLAVNARDAMPDGGRLTIATHALVLDEEAAASQSGAQSGAHVVLTISDTGTGMDEETRGRIFEPFFTTKEQGKGTGLGLSTVYGIVRQSGGFIEVESVEGHGTVFNVYLPRVEGAVEAAPAQAPAPAEIPRGSETILVVEDEDAVRNLVRGFLQRSGYRVIEARDGNEALFHSEMHDGEIDLLLTDVVMPEMSGRELAQRLIQSRPDTRIMFMSGYTDDMIVQHELFPGAILLQKPFAPEILARTVREVLDTESGLAATGSDA